VLDVIADGLRRDLKPQRDLLVQQSASKQSQDLDLPRGETGRSHRSPRRLVPGGGQHRVHGLAVQAPVARLCPQLVQRFRR
jgi:hypothetical protein